jgi:hypothetical protein
MPSQLCGRLASTMFSFTESKSVYAGCGDVVLGVLHRRWVKKAQTPFSPKRKKEKKRGKNGKKRKEKREASPSKPEEHSFRINVFRIWNVT